MPSYFFHLKFELYPPTHPLARHVPGLKNQSVERLDSLPAYIPANSSLFFSTDLPTHSLPTTPRPGHTRQKSKSAKEKEPVPSEAAVRARRASLSHRHPDWRFGRVSVKAIDMAAAIPTAPAESGSKPQKQPKADVGASAAKARFIPLQTKHTEFGYGVVHLYRDVEETPGLYSAALRGEPQKSDATPEDIDALTTVAVLAVPSYMTPSDFMGFVGDQARETVSHFRMIRTGEVSRYMVLIKFRTTDGAKRFVKNYNGKPFNSMEPENCHVVYVKSIHFESPATPKSQNRSSAAFPELSHDPFSSSYSPVPPAPLAPSSSTAAAVSNTSPVPSHISVKPVPPPAPSMVELPTCPVCLERMDETTGLLTILCNHVFHCDCLSKWKDCSCPVCRYSQNSRMIPFAGRLSEDDEADDEPCRTCGAVSNLWVCLVCGNVGCGRYDSAHAFEHYKETAHCYAMDIESQRVWDYAGDGYVHRLVQNKADGKLVELTAAMSGSEDYVPQEKLEKMGLEYTYLLTSQLDSQRSYYEEKVAQAADKASRATQTAEKAVADAKTLAKEMEELRMNYCHLAEDVVPGLEKEKMRAENKAAKATDMARRMEKEWRDEKKVNEGLMEKIKFLTKENEERSSDVKELQEQLRDIMFHLNASNTMKDASEDVVEGSVTVGDAPKEGKRRKGKGKK